MLKLEKENYCLKIRYNNRRRYVGYYDPFSPNVSYKTDGHTRGNKGVGTTYLAYGFCKMH